MNKLLRKHLYNLILHVLITAIIVVIGMLIMKHRETKIVKIDLVAITTHYTQMMLHNTMSSNNPDDPAVKKISDAVKTNLEPIITDYAKEHNVVIIQAQALVDTATPDITEEIINQLDRRIK